MLCVDMGVVSARRWVWLPRALLVCAATILVCFSAPAGVSAAPISAEYPRERLGPGQVVIYWIQRSSGVVRVFELHDRHPSETLTSTAQEALQLAPLWVQPALFDKLVQLSDDVQDALASAILRAQGEDPRLVDEVAFCVAATAPEELDPELGDPLDPELLLENARRIYAAAELLKYVELVELGDRTTARYRMLIDGQEVFWELPWEDYYWWVVHPRTGSDHTGYVDPRTAEPLPRAEGGRFWRSYLQDPAPEPDYTREFSLKVPLVIHDAELQGWGPAATGWLSSEAVDPLVVAARAADGLPVWLRYSYHQPQVGGTNNGTIIATTMAVERAYEEGSSDLLVNLLAQGEGVVQMIPGLAGNRVLVLKDRDPFGRPTVEDVLAQEGYDYIVRDSTAFATFTTWEDLDVLDVEKVVVPSDQPRLLYQRLSDGRDVINGWVGRAASGKDMVFELHGAVDSTNPGDDWTDLELPGQLRGYAPADTTDEVMVLGYPRPMEVMAAAEYAWDGRSHPSLSGDRSLAATAMALDRLGWVVSQSLDNNVGEIPEDFRGPDGECGGRCVLRTEEAERVIYGHYGNCGENAHLWVAVGRMALLPVAEVGTMAEDHVWNEILLRDRWLPCQTDWSDNDTRIDNPGNAYDKDVGGSKDISVVSGARGDGLLTNSTGRYSNTVTLSVTVTDSAGRPADGARIVVANESFYDPSALSLSTVEFADVTGHAKIQVGDLQSYYLQVTHPSGGVWPDADHVQWVACATPDALDPGGAPCEPDMPTTDLPDADIPIHVQLDGPAIPALEVTEADASDLELSGHRLSISFGVGPEILYGTAFELSPFTHSRVADPSEAGLDLYLLDQQNVERYAANEPFTALEVWDDVLGVVGEIALPKTSSDYFLVVSNARKGSTAYHYNLSIAYIPAEDATEVDPDSPGRGCGCSAGANAPPSAWMLLAGLGLALLTRRRKRRP